MATAETTYSFLTPASELTRGSMAAEVASQLRDAIVSLKLPPGTMLDKAQICTRLGVSRSPVAEAFARLEAEGLLEILPQRGTVVSFISFAEIREYIFIRKALEGEAVRICAARRAPEVIERLRANIAAQRDVAAAENRDAFHKLDLEFHEQLLAPLGYKRMKAMVDTARNNLDRARQMTNTMRRIALGIEEHAEIVELIAAGKADRAARAMHRHLEGMISELEALASERPELFIRPAPRRAPAAVIHQLATIRRLPST
ncbi:GntR family transcriptional regulator [Pelagibacterium sp. 26DY04]|uniref:GntR family transcriptional regulator n=1 Tax=Pelagibacterium sp. 26DY04 TaxID=2967130 RepID=UPI00281634CD|nr:GntR family transcriptional regulator [Pelagibacterium sp. 26DY04]WMT86423.1 GntR family transcriptional regulator [Pelagibacterium sp. 26DY04]